MKYFRRWDNRSFHKDGDKIVEIACIETEDRFYWKYFHEILNPERKFRKRHSSSWFSDTFLKNKPKFRDISLNFLNFIKDKKLIIHNAKFDVGFLNSQLKELKLKEINFNNVIDSLEVARNKYPGVSNSLDSLCKRYNIDLSRRTKHNVC